ncbi:MAG: hypothetical protein ACOYKM_09965 [Caulobacterales bacterium]
MSKFAPRATQSLFVAGALAGACALFGGAIAYAEEPGTTLPDWFVQERAASGDKGYPSLDDIPEAPSAKTDPAYWQAFQAEVLAAGAQMRASARATPAPSNAAVDAEAFRNGALEDIEDTRQRY